MEIARRRGDFAIVGVAAQLTLGDRNECTDVRLVFCWVVGETPVDASPAAGILIGYMRRPEKTCAMSRRSVRKMVEPAGNVHATADYQRHIAGVLAGRALLAAYQRVRDGQ